MHVPPVYHNADIQGGLKQTLLQDWTSEAFKRVIMITDVEPHGHQYQNQKYKDWYH